MNTTNNTASEKIMVATRDAGPVVKGFKYAVAAVGERHCQVRSLGRAEPYTHTFTREVFGG